MANTVRLALIGFGEVGQTFARDFGVEGKVRIAAYDLLFDDPRRRSAMLERAKALGVEAAVSAATAAREAQIVISAVTADRALEVATRAAAYLRPGQIFFDVNSAAPQTKRAAAEPVDACGASYVEGAVMAPVKAPGFKVPILAGGKAAEAAAELLNGLGMNIRVVADEAGRASAMKLCRSIVIKGLEAIMIDCAAAARLADVEREVFASLHESFPSIDFAELATLMAGRVRQHGVRRAAEMREAASMVAGFGLDPGLCAAIADAQERGAATSEPDASMRSTAAE